MGNAITNPERFIEKKIGHEIFGLPDPKRPETYGSHAQCVQAARTSAAYDQYRTAEKFDGVDLGIPTLFNAHKYHTRVQGCNQHFGK